MTKIFTIKSSSMDLSLIREAAEIIKNKGTVAFPTETVYGLGANGLEEEAVRKIFIAKGRPSDNPLILHISDLDMLDELVVDIPPKAKCLSDKLWPGPLTLIYKRSDLVPNIITAGLQTVAIRMPSNPIAQSLIRQANVPIAAPSANISGRPSTTKAEHVMEDLFGKVDGIILSEDSTIGLESTVLDVTEDIPILLRPGAVTLEEIESLIGQVRVDEGVLHHLDREEVKSPGMKYKHYAPKAPVKVVRGEVKLLADKINEFTRYYKGQGKKVGILATDESLAYYKADRVISMGKRAEPVTIMAKLFDCLREFDKYEIDIILAEGFSGKGVELALSNRLNKAAGHDITEV